MSADNKGGNGEDGLHAPAYDGLDVDRDLFSPDIPHDNAIREARYDLLYKPWELRGIAGDKSAEMFIVIHNGEEKRKNPDYQRGLMQILGKFQGSGLAIFPYGKDKKNTLILIPEATYDATLKNDIFAPHISDSTPTQATEMPSPQTTSAVTNLMHERVKRDVFNQTRVWSDSSVFGLVGKVTIIKDVALRNGYTFALTGFLSEHFPSSKYLGKVAITPLKDETGAFKHVELKLPNPMFLDLQRMVRDYHNTRGAG
jgi:hypothetical protein